MRAAIFAGIAVLLATPAHGADYLGDIAIFCEIEWGSDYAMQEHCREKQAKAWFEFARYSEIPEGPVGDEMVLIIDRCKGEWTDGGLVDWAMTVYCAKKQLRAFKALR